MTGRAKITTGANDAPRDATIAQTGEGIPDDSSRPVEIDEASADRMRRKLLGEEAGSPSGGTGLNPGDDAAPGTAGTGEDICPACGGDGRVDGRECPNCGGTGRVVKGIAGG